MTFRFGVAVAVVSLACTNGLLGDELTGPRTASTPIRKWSFESATADGVRNKGGKVRTAAGVRNRCCVLDGGRLLEARESAALGHGQDGFTLVVWLNPYNLDLGQQMIAAKNRYSLNQREWGVMVDSDQKLRLYLRQANWRTVAADERLIPGRWHQVAVVVRPAAAELWLNGARAGAVKLPKPLPRTEAPLTFGGVDDNGRIRQTLHGALDEAALFDRPLTDRELKSLYTPVNAVHPIPESASPVHLWDPAAELPVAPAATALDGVSFHVIKKWDQKRDGYTFLHGVGLGWHNGKLYASIGHNKGTENTVTEEAQYRVSADRGKSWSELRVIDAGKEDNLAVSHGVFLSHGGTLWAFHGAYYNRMQRVHTRAYTLDEATGQWRTRGVVVRDGFWPMNQPVKMADGNWIMPGFSAGAYSNSRVFPAAVAISRGDDFTKWDYMPIHAGQGVQRMWGESAIFVAGKRVVNIARYGGRAVALVAMSDDYGRTWTPSRISNLPMATSKPAAGTLSTGQRFLVCTTLKNNGGGRSPLTIAVSRPGENRLSRVFIIRRSQNPGHAGESAPRLSLAYPCATEHDGHLYVGYSNNGGRRGNLNSAELAVIPIAALKP